MNVGAVILSVETATRRGSVCVARGDKILGFEIGDSETSHSNTLLRDIHKVLTETAISLSDVALLAAASGPGSFTGLRIGLATIKALSATLNVPCVGIPTLQAVARAAGSSPHSVALLPAGRGEVFAQKLSVSPDGLVVELDKPAHLTPQQLFERYGGEKQLRWCGEGAHLNQASLREWALEKGIDFSDAGPDPRAANDHGWQLAAQNPNLACEVAGLALNKLKQGDSGDPKLLRALYVRPSDAELKSNAKNTTGAG